MYTIIPELKPNDIGLIDTDSWIWIGIEATNNDIYEPIDRTQATRFRKCDVYLYNGKRVFSFKKNATIESIEYYYIPEEELLHIQKKD